MSFDSREMRILDANADRAREGLRVLEDYARFAINHDELSAFLKGLRHDLMAALSTFAGEAIYHRDTPGDVGTDNKTASELRRESLADVVTAAGKRLGEALRVLEEVSKIAPELRDAGVSAKIESIRYRFYDIEQRIARTLHPVGRFADVRLYVLITESLCKRPWLETAEQAIAGGADCLQLREKSIEGRELLSRARQLVALCHRHGVLAIINDRPDIARLADADGVHLGQDDLPATEVRKLLGAEKIIGVSTHHIEEARRAVTDGADYVGVGPMFASTTKHRAVAGVEYARQVLRETHLPVVAIGGITVDNISEVIATGVGCVAVTAAVISSDDPAGAARALKAAMPAKPHRLR